MNILRNNSENNLIFNNESNFKFDLGWSENFKDFENETLEKVINPIENYETVRYIHKPYSGITTNPNDLQSDIWFYFYFLSGGTYVQDYEATGLSLLENAKMLKQSTQSFFRLEFFKTTNNEPPERMNRRLVFAKNLTLPLGEQFYITKNDFYEKIFVPVFNGSNYKNTENMYFFWFNDDSSFNETSLTGTTFWMTAKYFNAKDGTILDFVNTCMGPTSEVVEYRDVYYKLEIDRSDFSYQIYNYTGTTGSRVGIKSNPIIFYEKGGGTCIPSTPTPTPMPTSTPTPTPTPSLGPTPTPTPTGPFATPQPTSTFTAPTEYYLQVRACHDINIIEWTATPFTVDVLTYGQIFWSEGGFFYTVVNASTTPQGGTLYGTRAYQYSTCADTPGYIP
jgi:hypothetical protein